MGLGPLDHRRARRPIASAPAAFLLSAPTRATLTQGLAPGLRPMARLSARTKHNATHAGRAMTAPVASVTANAQRPVRACVMPTMLAITMTPTVTMTATLLGAPSVDDAEGNKKKRVARPVAGPMAR